MPVTPTATKSWFPGPIRFSLAGLLVFMTGLGIFFGVRNIDGVRWDDPLKAAATFLFLAGIATQVRDLERARRAAGLSSSARLRWEQAWIRSFDQTTVAALIYIAIRGVEVAQPYRRGEVVIYDFQFFTAERE